VRICRQSLFLVFLLLYARPVLSQADYELSDSVLLQECPFSHGDSYNADSLLNLVKAQLETKLSGNQRCTANMNQLVQDLGVISNYFSQVDPNIRNKVQHDFYSRQLIELQLHLKKLELEGKQDSQDYLDVKSNISTLESNLKQNELDSLYNTESFSASEEATFRQKLFQHINNVVLTLGAADAGCIQHLGGWQQVLPPLIGTAALASGFGVFASQNIVGAVLQIAANLSTLLQNREVKKAINSIVELHNYEILACTYFSITNLTCEYGRALRLSNEKDDLLNLIQSHYHSGFTGEFEQYFNLLEQTSGFANLFTAIASMGSPVTLNLSLIYSYFQALATTADLPDPPPSSASDSEKKQWLISIEARGINDYVSASITPGGGQSVVTLDDKIRAALNDIKDKKATKDAIEENLRTTRSFVDLRHQLDAFSNHFILQVDELSNFFRKYLIRSSGAKVKNDAAEVPDEELGSLYAILQILDRVHDFLVISPTAFKMDTETGQLEYEKAINKEGLALFTAMAHGAVAQLSQQSLLSLASKVQERLSRAFQIVENAYVDRDLRLETPPEASFSQFNRDRSLKFHILDNFEQFTGAGTTFREEKFEQARSSFEQGFHDEILEMVGLAMRTRSQRIPELNGSTAPHLCSLFSSALSHDRVRGPFGIGEPKGKLLMSICRKNFDKLELVKYLTPVSVQIDYSNPCFYSEYVRTFEMQKVLLERYKQLKKNPSTSKKK